MSSNLHWYSTDPTTITATALTPVILDSAPETLTAAAPAVSVDKFLTILDATSNGVAATLADGQIHGQLKRVTAKVVAGGTTNLTIASPVSSSLNVVTFTVIGDTVDLIWNAEARYWRAYQFLDTDRNSSTPTIA